MINIAQFLNRLLQPIYESVAHKHTFLDGADAVEALETYMNNGHLRSTTLCTTLSIQHILTSFPHAEATSIVERFLHTHVPTNEVQGLSVDNLVQLIRFVLANQWFVYENKLYRQIYGGSCNIPLMSLLVNIILFDWEQEIITYLHNKKEVYGR